MREIIRGLCVALIAVFCAFTGPNGDAVYVQPSNVNAVVNSGKVGGAPTAIITSNGTVYVKEDVETVVERLRAVTEPAK